MPTTSSKKVKRSSTSKRVSKSPKVKKVLHEYKKGTLTSGRSGKKVTKRKQAVAIALSEARKASMKKRTKRKRSNRTIIV